MAISEAERQKIEEAVAKYMESERERQEEFRESRGQWLPGVAKEEVEVKRLCEMAQHATLAGAVPSTCISALWEV